VACALDLRISEALRFTDRCRIREHLRVDELRDLSPPIYRTYTKYCRARTKCRSFHKFAAEGGQPVFYSPHRVVASRRGPQRAQNRTFYSARPSKLARRSDADCLIRQRLKFCQRRAGFSGSHLEKNAHTWCTTRDERLRTADRS
jgi:hypothetical protein